ncbi:hypothetical protein BGZ46_006027 [Entomortierella lignicola]|nr:hypothetical protein BGZ46_006027 [Entomortierella lignicola]
MMQNFPIVTWRGVSIPFPIPHPASSPPFIKSTALSRAATIFDIPLIVDLICSYLTPKEIWTCYRVNTAWRELFGIHRYQDVRFANTNSGQTWDILENARRIRALKIDITEGQLFLDSPTVLSWPSYTTRSKPECTHLQELACIDLRYSCNCSSKNEHEWWCSFPRDSTYVSALDLIHQNPLLERLNVNSTWLESSRDGVFNDQILSSLSGMRFLVHLTVKIYARDRIPKILENLPASLQELELDTEDYDELDSIQEMTTTGAAHLRQLCIRGSIAWLTPTILALFQMLEDVTLTVLDRVLEEQIKSALITHCPKINSMCFLDELDSVSTLISAYPKGLRSLQTKSPLKYNDSILTMTCLLNHSMSTLETLRLDCHLWRVSPQVGTILRSCPNLKVLELKFRSSSKGKGVALRDILFDKNSASYPFGSSLYTPNSTTTKYIPNHTSWACRNLEELRLTISDTSGPLWDLPFEEKQIWTARLIGQLYQELRSLERLTNLNLNWKCGKNDLGDKFTCELGLRIMAQNSQPSRYRMSKDDLEWMNIRWLTLAEIEEIKRKEELESVADIEFKKRNQSRQQWYDISPIYQHYCQQSCTNLCDVWREDFDEWSFPGFRKKQLKTGKQYYRRSLKNEPSKKILKRHRNLSPCTLIKHGQGGYHFASRPLSEKSAH